MPNKELIIKLDVMKLDMTKEIIARLRAERDRFKARCAELELRLDIGGNLADIEPPQFVRGVTFCPNCERETECEHTAELYECKECGEDFAKYIVSRKLAESDVSMTEDVLTDIKTSNSAESDDLGGENAG